MNQLLDIVKGDMGCGICMQNLYGLSSCANQRKVSSI